MRMHGKQFGDHDDGSEVLNSCGLHNYTLILLRPCDKPDIERSLPNLWGNGIYGHSK
jgi:hypothetical protein